MNYVTALGCDSVETVQIEVMSTDLVPLQLWVCEGENVEYNGASLSAGMQEDFTFSNQFGCDSIVSVTVAGWPIETVALALGSL